MGLMVAGALVMILLSTWEGQILGRLLAGTGGVLLNVLMSKVVTDHFAGREIGTAMGIFVNSWPVGIAAALLFLPLVGGAEDPQIAQIVVAATTFCGLLLFFFGTRAPAQGAEMAPAAIPLKGKALAAIVLAGGIWGLYNCALGMVFGFGPAMLVEQGWALAKASAVTSFVLWVVAISIPLGGYLADLTQRHDTVMSVGFAGFALLLCLAPTAESTLLLFAILGLFGGLSAGPIMSLPAIVLAPGNRALGMGVFFTLFYVGVVFAPILAGMLSERAGSSRIAFYFGVCQLGLCFLGLIAFKRLTRTKSARLEPKIHR